MGAFGKMSGMDCRRFVPSPHPFPLLLIFRTPSQPRSQGFSSSLRVSLWKRLLCRLPHCVKPTFVCIYVLYSPCNMKKPKTFRHLVNKGPVALGDKNFVSSAEFQEKFWFNKFLFQIFCSGNSLVLHCASLLRTIIASSARAHERVHVQNVRDFPQTKLDNGINSPFLLNEHRDPRFFF